jgi:hypothetical protein
MFYFRLFFYAMLLGSFPSFAFANPEEIDSVMAIRKKVESLQSQGANPEDIVVVWDFHGVITAQGAPKKDVEATLNPGAIDVLDYLHGQHIPQIMKFNKILFGLKWLPILKLIISSKENFQKKSHWGKRSP